jgi:thiamine-monophosphate kinase
VSVDVRTDALEVAEQLEAVGAAMGVDPMTFVLTGGDDYGLVATFPPDVELPAAWRVIGSVGTTDGDEAAVTVDGEAYEPPAGHQAHQHFRG